MSVNNIHNRLDTIMCPDRMDSTTFIDQIEAGDIGGGMPDHWC